MDGFVENNQNKATTQKASENDTKASAVSFLR